MAATPILHESGRLQTSRWRENPARGAL